MNNEGTVIAGTIGLSNPRSVYWVNGSPPTINSIGFLPDGTYSYVSAIAGENDQLKAVGYGNTTDGVERAFYWKLPQGILYELPGLDNDIGSQASGMSTSSPLILVGFSRSAAGGLRAVRWNYSGGTGPRIYELTALEEASDCTASDINDDGNVIVGTCDYFMGFPYARAVCWLEGTTTNVTSLPCLGDCSSSRAYAVSGNGTVIVGSSTQPGNPYIEHAVCWKLNPSNNTFDILDLEVHPDPFQEPWNAHAHGVNHDGTIIVGTCVSSNGAEAFIWKSDSVPKVRKLEDATDRYKASQAYDVTTKEDNTVIVVGNSSFCENHSFGGKIAVSWETPSLSIRNLHFPS